MLQYDPLPAKVCRVGGTVKTYDEPHVAFKLIHTVHGRAVATLRVDPGRRVVYPQSPGQSWNNTKLRVEHAHVIDIDAQTDRGRSIVRPSFAYVEGAPVEPDSFDPTPATVDAPGIHVFPDRRAAAHWDPDHP